MTIGRKILLVVGSGVLIQEGEMSIGSLRKRLLVKEFSDLWVQRSRARE